MTRRLTVRTLAASALIIVVVGVVLGGLAFAIDRQHDAGERARHSQAVIASANLTAAAAAGGPDQHPRLPDPRQRRPADDYRQAARRSRTPRWSSRGWSPTTRSSRGAPRRSASRPSSYVNDYGDPVIARTREAGVGAGRTFAAAHDGSARATSWPALDWALVAAERVLSDPARHGRRRRLATARSDRRARARAAACCCSCSPRGTSRAGSCCRSGASRRPRRGSSAASST